MPETIKVASRADLRPGEFRALEVSGTRIVLYNLEGTYYATGATCAHQGGPLGDGLFEDGIVTCPWHAWQFDVCTGKAVYDPGFRVPTYRVQVEGDDVLVEV